MNPYTPQQWIDIEAKRQSDLARIAVEHPPIDQDELRERCRHAARVAMVQDGTLADAMRKLPAGEFCAWGGLNPHRVAVGEDVPRCRCCTRNDTCTQPFKVPGW